MKLGWVAAAVLAVGCLLVLWQARIDRHAVAAGEAVAERAVLGLSNAATDLRFRIRGPRPPQANVVIASIDSAAIGQFGRWPWHRDTMAALIDAIGNAGPAAIGLDMVFSEPDDRATPQLRQALAERGLAPLADAAETDPALAAAIAKHAAKLVLGWQTDAPCRPAAEGPQSCPAADPQFLAAIPPSHGLFSLAKPKGAKLDARTSPLMTAVTVAANIDAFASQASRAGFYNAFLDADGTVRTAFLVMAAGNRLHPSLALAMAAVGWGGKPAAVLNNDGSLASLKRPDGSPLPVDALGRLRANFYGPGRTFAYVSAADILAGKAAALAKLRGAHVLVGLSALGAHDMRAFPFDSNVPGVEGHATILANLLENSAFAARDPVADAWILAAVLLAAGALAVWLLQRLEALRGLLAGIGLLGLLAAVDVRLFAAGHWFDTGAVYACLGALLAAGLGVRYWQEQRTRSFVRNAFARYVPPAVVDAIIAHPDQLALGGEKRPLTVLFSDIRGFTTVSERLDPRELVALLNLYLGKMTDIVFEHRGTLDKYIGDAVMAFWGAPVPLPDHPRQALQAAVDMIRAVDELRPAIAAKWGVELRIGIGLCTGTVSVGNMGSERNLAYTVLGDRVNLAARLESLTKTYGAEILTTADTLHLAEQAGGTFWARPVDWVRVKGKSEPVEVVQVFARQPDAGELQAFEKARALYLAENFAEADAAFADLERAGPDPLYTLMRQRCAHFLQQPPRADWSGAWTMESK